MASTVTNPDLLAWLRGRNAFGGQYGSPNQGTQVASAAPPQGNVLRRLLFDNPQTDGSDQARINNFGSGVNPYPEPGPATLTGGFNRWLGRAGGENLDHLRPPGWSDNPASSFMAKYDPRWEGRRRTGRLSGLGDAAMMTFGGQIPGAGLFTAAAKLFNQLGAHHEYNPARDSNLFYETDRGRMTYDSMDPGGGGEQMGSLNNYNMFMAMAANDPDREIQTEHGWMKVGDLAELIKNRPMGQVGHSGPRNEQPTLEYGGFSKTPTTFDQMASDYTSGGESMSNEDALRSLETRHGDAWNAVASQLNPDGTKMGYDEQVAAAAKAEQMLRGQRDSTKLVPQETSTIAAKPPTQISSSIDGGLSKMDARTSHMEAMDLGLDMGRGWRDASGSFGKGLFFGPEEEDPGFQDDMVKGFITGKSPELSDEEILAGKHESLLTPKTVAQDPKNRPTLSAAPQQTRRKDHYSPITLSDIHKTVIQIESGGNKDAEGSATERGEYQVKESTLKKPGYGIKPLDPKKDVKEERTRVGKEYLDKMLDIFSDYKNPVATALVAYNKGPGFAKNWAERGSNLFELQGQAIGYLQKFHDENPDYITVGTGKELTPSGSEMNVTLPDIVDNPPLKPTPLPPPLSVFVDTTSNDAIEEAYGGGQDWDSYDIDTDTGEQGHWY
jgi:hypothetical protein